MGAAWSEGVVESVHAAARHTMGKPAVAEIELLTDLGVKGDAHAGVTVQHRSRVRVDPSAPNLRQVHLIDAELHDELRELGFAVTAGVMGENITTRGAALLALPTGARLRLGSSAVLEVTGLRTPCAQLDGVEPGLRAAVLGRDERGEAVRRAGVMAIVVHGGLVRPGDRAIVELPPLPHRPLQPV